MTKVVDLFCLERRIPNAKRLDAVVPLLIVRSGSVLSAHSLYQVGEGGVAASDLWPLLCDGAVLDGPIGKRGAALLASRSLAAAYQHGPR
jgi:hypothetical protein